MNINKNIKQYNNRIIITFIIEYYKYSIIEFIITLVSGYFSLKALNNLFTLKSGDRYSLLDLARV